MQDSTTKLAISVQEAAELCSVGRDKVYAAINDGQLRSCKVGKRRLVRISALRTWLESLERATSAGMGFGDDASDVTEKGKFGAQTCP